MRFGILVLLEKQSDIYSLFHKMFRQSYSYKIYIYLKLQSIPWVQIPQYIHTIFMFIVWDPSCALSKVRKHS